MKILNFLKEIVQEFSDLMFKKLKKFHWNCGDFIYYLKDLKILILNLYGKNFKVNAIIILEIILEILFKEL